jgi:Tfp pilus assembly protein PilO
MKAKQFYFVLIALLILSIAGIVGAFVWGKGQLKTSSMNASNLIAERDAQRDVIITLQQAEARSKEVENINALLDRLLPTEKNQEALVLDIIYTATAEASIPISNISSFSFSGGGDPDALSGTETYKEVPGVLAYPFNVELKDISYPALLTLLNEIETNSRIVHVDNLTISPNKNDPGLLSSVNLSLKAYVKP